MVISMSLSAFAGYDDSWKKGFSAVWQESAGNVAWSTGKTKSVFEGRIKKHLGNGYRLGRIDIHYSRKDKKLLYSGVWKKTTTPSRYVLGVTRSEFMDKHDANKKSGYSLISFNIDKDRYAAVWRKDGKKQRWITRRSLDSLKSEIKNNKKDNYELIGLGHDKTAKDHKHRGYYAFFRQRSSDFKTIVILNGTKELQDVSQKIQKNYADGYVVNDLNYEDNIIMVSMRKAPGVQMGLCFECTIDEVFDMNDHYRSYGLRLTAIRRNDHRKSNMPSISLGHKYRVKGKSIECNDWVGASTTNSLKQAIEGTSNSRESSAITMAKERLTYADLKLSRMYFGKRPKPFNRGSCYVKHSVDVRTPPPPPPPPKPKTYWAYSQVESCGNNNGHSYIQTSNWGLNYPKYRAESSKSIDDAHVKAFNQAMIDMGFPTCWEIQFGACCNYIRGQNGVN